MAWGRPAAGGGKPGAASAWGKPGGSAAGGLIEKISNPDTTSIYVLPFRPFGVFGLNAFFLFVSLSLSIISRGTLGCFPDDSFLIVSLSPFLRCTLDLCFFFVLWFLPTCCFL